MIAHGIEVRRKETSYIRIVSSITDAYSVSVSLAFAGFGRGIRRVGGWLGLTLVLQYAYAGVKIVGDVGVPFYAEAMRDVAEVTSLAVGLF